MSEREEPEGSFSIFYAEGEIFSKLGQFDKAVDSFTKALDLQPDEGCLVARSHCYLQLGNTTAALKDADDSLSENKMYHKGLYQKAEVLYATGNFEHALMFYHRGHNIRPQMHEFMLGIQKAQEAINNSIGSTTACRLENIGDLSFFREQDVIGKKKAKKLMKPATYMRQKKEGMRKERKTVVASEKIVKELLGELYHDREYLDKLMKDPSLLIKNKDYSIYNTVEDALIYLDERTEFWRQQKPMYARKREKELKKFKPPPTKPITVRTESMQRTKEILKSLETIDEALTNGEAAESLKHAKRLLKTTKKLTVREIHNKQELLAHIHSCIGNAQLELGEAEFALRHHLKDLEIAEELGIVENLSRALDSVARVYAWMGEYQDAIIYYEKKLPLIGSSEESAWLHHELARCRLEMGQYSMALKLGEEAFDAAVDADDNIWQLNANMLLSQIKKRMGDIDGAIEFFKRTMELAIALNDESTQAVVKSALEELEHKFKKYEGGGEEEEDGEGGEVKEKSGREDGDEEKDDEHKDKESDVEKAGGEYEKEKGSEEVDGGQSEVEGSVERGEETEGEQKEIEGTGRGQGMLEETEEGQEEFEENDEMGKWEVEGSMEGGEEMEGSEVEVTEGEQGEVEGSEETIGGQGKVEKSQEGSKETEEQGETEGGQTEVEGSEDGRQGEVEGSEEGSEAKQGEMEGREEGSEEKQGEVEGSEEGSEEKQGDVEGGEEGSKEKQGEVEGSEEMEGQV